MSDLTLYEIAPWLREIVEAEEFDAEALDIAVGEFKMKASGICHYLDEMQGFIDMAKGEEKRIAQRRKAVENQQTHLKAYLQSNMEVAELTKLEIGTKKLMLQNNPPKVVVDEEESIPAKFIRIVQSTSVDKVALKDALKLDEVPGCHLEQSVSLRIK